MKKKILIISEFFAPENSIAAVRFTKICKYLSQTGSYQFYIIKKENTLNIEDGILKQDIEGIRDSAKILSINPSEGLIFNIYRLFKKPAQESATTTRRGAGISYEESNLKDKISFFIHYSKHLLLEYRFYHISKKKIRKSGMNDVAAVISTYGGLGAHLTGCWFKKAYQVPWIADYRDAIMGKYVPDILKPFYKRKIIQFAQYADKVVGVSRGTIDKHPYPKKNVIITNGYDREDIAKIECIKEDDKLHITYTGYIYPNIGDLSPLLQVIDDLEKEGKIEKEKIIIDYAGSSFHEMKKQVEKYHMENNLVNHGYLQRKAALKLQKKSDILLVLSRNTKKEMDIFSGKFFEYMMMGHPMIVLITGDLPNSGIKKIIKDTELGICYEEAAKKQDYLKLKQYVYELYQEYCSNNILQSKANKRVIEYDYKTISNKYEVLIKQLTE